MMLKIDHLSKQFGSFNALEDIFCEIQPSESVALLGPNGSGKTTLIKCALGLVVPDKGEVSYGSQRISHPSFKEKVGYMPQIGRYPENMRIKDLFDMMLDLRGKKMRDCDTELYEQFEFEMIANKRLGNLSGGMKQKVGAVLAFMFRPEILFLDEPTAGLDPYSSTILKAKIQKVCTEGKLVVITSHIIADLEEIVSRVMYLLDGKLYFYKPVEQLKSETNENRLEKALARIMTDDDFLRQHYVTV